MPNVMIDGFMRDSATGALATQPASQSAYDPNPNSNGMLATIPPPAYATQAALVSATTLFSRFVPQRNMTIVRAEIQVISADGSSPVSGVGIMSAAGARLASSGDLTGKVNAVGKPSYPLTASITLTAGTVYYTAFSIGSTITPPTVATMADYAYAFETAVGQLRGAFVSAAAVPATMAGAAQTPTGVVMMLREV